MRLSSISRNFAIFDNAREFAGDNSRSGVAGLGRPFSLARTTTSSASANSLAKASVAIHLHSIARRTETTASAARPDRCGPDSCPAQFFDFIELTSICCRPL